MYCKRCGSIIENPGSNCPVCGYSNREEQEKKESTNQSPGNNTSMTLSLLLVILLIVSCIFVFTNLNSKKEKTSSSSSSSVISNNSANSTSNEESNIEIESNSTSNSSSTSNTTSSSNTTPSSLTCTKTVNDESGVYQSTVDYTFKGGTITSYHLTVKATLNSGYTSYRDTIISQYDEEMKQATSVTGIERKVEKKSNGFTYQIIIADSDKVDKAQLKSMNLYLVNYSGVKMSAYKNGYECK